MGTGSFGGGGSGGSGKGWGTGGLQGYYFESGKFVSGKITDKEVIDATCGAIHKFSPEYRVKQFSGNVVRKIYHEVFDFVGKLGGDHLDRQQLYNDYKIDLGAGFLVGWITELMRQFDEKFEPDQKIRETVQICVEDFFVRLLGDDLQALMIYQTGTCDQVIAKLDKNVISKRSGYFFGNLIRRILEREFETQPVDVQVRIKQISQQLADHLIENYMRFMERAPQYDHKRNYRNLFEAINERPDILIEKVYHFPDFIMKNVQEAHYA